MGKTFTRRQLLVGAATLVGASAVSSRFVEPTLLEVCRVRVELGPELGAPLTILHLTDLHHSNKVSLSFIDRAIRLGLEQGPTIACLTGDYITRRHRIDEAAYEKTLSLLPRSIPTFATLGNHDGGYWAGDEEIYGTSERIRRLLERAGVTVLHNRWMTVELGGASLTLVGVGDIWAGELDPKEAFTGIDRAGPAPIVALSHNPDTKERMGDYPWRLMLCGHTHGGQVKIPFYGAVFAPIEDFDYIEGLNRWRDRLIYTSRGVGNVFGYRFNCRPEVTVMELVPT